MKEKIENRIKELRINKLKITQDEFSKFLGFDRTYLSRIESGKQNITLDTLDFICRNLNVSFFDFFSVTPFKDM